MFGDKNGKAMMEATAGSFTGIGEIVLLPLDVLKIKRQCVYRSSLPDRYFFFPDRFALVNVTGPIQRLSGQEGF